MPFMKEKMSESSEKETDRFFSQFAVFSAVMILLYLLSMQRIMSITGVFPAEAAIFSFICVVLVTAYSVKKHRFGKHGAKSFILHALLSLILLFTGSMTLVRSLSKGTQKTVKSVYESFETGKNIYSLHIPAHVRFSVSSDKCMEIQFHRGHETGEVRTGQKKWEKRKIKRDELQLWFERHFYEIKDCGELFILVNNHPMSGCFKVKYTSDGKIVSVEKPIYRLE